MHHIAARVLDLSPRSHAQYSYAAILEQIDANSLRWLDIGCGHQVVPEWTTLDRRFTPTLGVDPDHGAVSRHLTAKHRVCGDGTNIPVADASFDLVTANMVLEHVAEPMTFFAEMARVLRPGGACVVLTPNALAYPTRLARLLPEAVKAPLAAFLHQRHAVDVYPAHYRANDAYTLRELGAMAGLEMHIQAIQTGPQMARLPVVGALERFYLKHRGAHPCLLAAGVKP